VLGPLNSLLEESTDPNRYTAKAKFCFCKNNKRTIIIKADEFQKLFRIGYAFTTHSAQGMSIDKPYTIHEFNRMDQKLKYVALSRATKYENINIIM